MSYLKPMRYLVLALFVTGTLALMGCASKPKETAAAAPPPPPKPVGLSQIKTELMEAKGQIDTTTGALNTLSKSSQADAQANFNKFSEEYMKLQAKSDTVKSRAKDLKDKTAAYYATWNKQIEVENPELKRQALQQKADAERTFTAISNDMELARISFNPYMANLKDVGNYLRGILSPASITSASELVTKANAQAKQVNTNIDSIVSSIDKIGSATGESTAAQPAAGASSGTTAQPAAGSAAPK